MLFTQFHHIQCKHKEVIPRNETQPIPGRHAAGALPEP